MLIATSRWCQMPTQVLPAASLRSARRLPAARTLFRAANYLICMTLWSIGRAIFRAAANFLPALQELELLERGLAVRHRQRHMVDRDLAVGQHPIGGRRQVHALDQRDGVMGQLAVIDRTVKAHLRRVRAIGPLVQLADLLEADD